MKQLLYQIVFYATYSNPIRISRMDKLWQRINEAIHRRDAALVRKLIPKYVQSHKSSPEAIYEASEFFRKNADYVSAIRILPKEPRQAAPGVSEIETKLELHLARLLSILGAPRYALRMIDRIRADNRAKSKIEMAEIYHCSYRYRDVLELLGPNYPLPKSEPWHQDWLLHFYYAWALSGTRQKDLAIRHVDGIYALSQSPLIRAMALHYKGQFILEQGEPKRALSLLLEAKKFFKDNDHTSDYGNLQKSLGICFLKLGRLQEAADSLKKALGHYHQPSMNPDDWMEIVVWLEQIPGYKEDTRHFAPRLSSLRDPLFPPLTDMGVTIPSSGEDIFSVSKIEKSQKRRHFDRASDVFWDGYKARLGIDLVDELICHLIYAGRYGLPQFKLYELLWPDEPFSFSQHQKRLERLVGRARARGYEIIWKNLHLKLSSSDVSASGRPEKVIRGFSFLAENPIFTRSGVQKYFSLSLSSANALCKSWLESGVAKMGPGFRYRATLS